MFPKGDEFVLKNKEDVTAFLSEFMSKDYVKANKKIFQKLTDLQKDIDKDFYSVVVLGEFKHGKSTFVNALLGTKILPMDVLPETATINAIMYDEKPRLSILYRDGTEVKGTVDYDYLKQFSAGNNDSRLKNISYIKIGYPCELLKERIVLIDTPGVSDLNEQRSEITYRFIPKANAVLFLLNTRTPLKATEIDFIEEKLLPLGINNIIFLLNKYDEHDEEEDPNYLDKVKKRLLKAFSISSQEAKLRDITLYPLSAKLALKGIETGNKKLIEESGLNAVIDKLRSMLFYGNVEQQKILGYAKRLSIIENLLRSDLEGEKTMKAADISELEKASEALEVILREHDSNSKIIDNYVEAAKLRMYAMTDKSIEHFYGKLRENVLEMIRQYQNQDFKNYIESTVTKYVRKNIESWIGAYAPHIDELLMKMEKELSKGLSLHFNQQIQLRASKGEKLQNMLSVMNVTANDISNTSFHSSAITAVGAVAVAAIVTPLLLPAVGFFGRQKIFEKMLSGRLDKAKMDIVPQIENQLSIITDELSQHVHEYINQKSAIIQKNTFMAYESIVSDIQTRIQAQIDEKHKTKSNLQAEFKTLEKNLDDLKNMVSRIEVVMS